MYDKSFLCVICHTRMPDRVHVAQQLGALVQVDLSEADKLPEAKLAELCGVFAKGPRDQYPAFALCSEDLGRAIKIASTLCGGDGKDEHDDDEEKRGSGVGSQKPVIGKPGSGVGSQKPVIGKPSDELCAVAKNSVRAREVFFSFCNGL